MKTNIYVVFDNKYTFGNGKGKGSDSLIQIKEKIQLR